jgi:hypothetical protein
MSSGFFGTGFLTEGSDKDCCVTSGDMACLQMPVRIVTTDASAHFECAVMLRISRGLSINPTTLRNLIRGAVQRLGFIICDISLRVPIDSYIALVILCWPKVLIAVSVKEHARGPCMPRRVIIETLRNPQQVRIRAIGAKQIKEQ